VQNPFWQFLTFERLISLEVLMVFYALGAFVLPLFLWWLFYALLRKQPTVAALLRKGRKALWQRLSVRQRFLSALAFMSALLFMELLWRMLFEFLIAFLQMRDSLMMLTQ